MGLGGRGEGVNCIGKALGELPMVLMITGKVDCQSRRFQHIGLKSQCAIYKGFADVYNGKEKARQDHLALDFPAH